jgi:hypothetical protein
MPKPRPITKQELAAIRQSVTEAVKCAARWRTAEARRWNRKKRRKGYTEAHFRADELLENLAYVPRPPLNDPAVRSTMIEAIERSDTRFFIRLGKVLARRPKPRPTFLEARINVPIKLVQFLICRWADATKELPELFYLTPEVLADVCSENVGYEISTNAVVKLRQRLGLKPFKRTKIQAFRSEGKWNFRKPFK